MDTIKELLTVQCIGVLISLAAFIIGQVSTYITLIDHVPRKDGVSKEEALDRLRRINTRMLIAVVALCTVQILVIMI